MVMADAPTEWRLTPEWLVSGMLVAVSAAFALFEALQPGGSIDLGFVWAAGRMFNHGLDPYSPAFEPFTRSLFSEAKDWAWFYPPQWTLPASLLARFSFPTACLIWRLTNVLFLAIAAWAIVRTWAAIAVRPRPTWLALTLALIFSGEATGAVFYLGQTGILVLLGFALFTWGSVGERRSPAIFGLTLLMVKPNIGLPVAIVALATPFHRRALLGACIVSLLFCLPLFVQRGAGIGASLLNWERNLSVYGAATGYNQPIRMTGLSHILSMPAIATSLVAAAVGLALAFGYRRTRYTDTGEAIALVACTVTAAFVSLHNYDLSFVAILVLLGARGPVAARVCFVAGALLFANARRIASHVALNPEVVIGQAHIGVIAGMIIVVGTLLWLVWPRRRAI
jgi:hypothetical protein